MTGLPLDGNYIANLLGSLELYLYGKVVTPYNTAVTGTGYASPVRIQMEDPDDYSTLEQVPVILLDYPVDAHPPMSTGVGDQEMWVCPMFDLKVYPGVVMDAATGSELPSRNSANLLRSLFAGITTSLLVPLYDLTTSNTTPVAAAYIDAARVMDTKGSMKDILAMEKFRFNFSIRLRFMVAATVN